MAGAGGVEPASLEFEGGLWRLKGSWTVQGVAALARRWPEPPALEGGDLVLDGGEVTALDSAGAWLLRERLEGLQQAAGVTLRLQGWRESRRALLESLLELELAPPPAPEPTEPGVVRLGRWGVFTAGRAVALHSLIGEAFLTLGRLLPRPWRIRWRLVGADLQHSGVGALLIVGLLSFLMGVVIAYQGAVQLKQYGANIYIADLIGQSMLRELGPLLTAIIVAGRTGSSYTAQIGTMQVTEEVAALRTLGLSPMEVLVLPKMISLMLALPLLSIFADITGVLGGLIMSKLQMDLSFTVFLDRFREAIPVKALGLGLYKTPVFAVIIAVIGCYQGLQVQGGAASVGHRTTIAVVQAISLVILVDAQFSIIYSWLGL